MVSAAEATRPATDSKVISGGSDDPAASRAYRGSFYACLSRRADALFELADAILTGGGVHSPSHLSLVPIHRRGWGSLYAAMGKGTLNALI